MFRAPALSCAHYFQAPTTEATPTVNWIWRTLPFLYPCESAVKTNSVGVKTVEHWSRTALQSSTVLERVKLSDSSRTHFSYWGLTSKKKESVKGCFTTDELFHGDYVITGCLLSIRVFECSITVTCSTLKKVLQVSVRRSLLTALNFRILSTDVIHWKLF